MYPFGDLSGQDLIDPALALDPVHALETRRDDGHAEVGFAAFPIRALARMMMAGVEMGFINDLEP